MWPFVSLDTNLARRLLLHPTTDQTPRLSHDAQYAEVSGISAASKAAFVPTHPDAKYATTKENECMVPNWKNVTGIEASGMVP